jgi:translocation and assembly module TamB
MGALEVPRADIALRELPEGAVTPSADVTVIGREQNAREPTTVSGETQIVLGDQVHISALGLDTRLRGSLMVKLAHDQPARATGEVTLVDGIFAAYGQKLTIKEGSLLFTGPLDNPLVDVRAVRVIDRIEGQVTAGIHLVGRAQSVSSTVYSEPAMSDANALSYLVIGRPLDQMEQIGQALGFDQLTLAGDGGDTTALVAGKQLSSRLHARYSYGVFSRLGTLLLRYDLSQRLTLEAGAGEIQSLDILYFLEKQ